MRASSARWTACSSLLLGVFSVGCGSSPCRQGDFLAPGLAGKAEGNVPGPADWMSEANACVVGRYVVFTPLDSKRLDLSLVGLDLSPVVAVSSDGLAIFRNDRWVAALSDLDNDGEFDAITYRAFRKETGLSTIVDDRDLDGQPEMRTVSCVGEEGARREVFRNGQWLERFEFKNESGVIRDGEFIPSAVLSRLIE